jgi:hypothetical protein
MISNVEWRQSEHESCNTQRVLQLCS